MNDFGKANSKRVIFRTALLLLPVLLFVTPGWPADDGLPPSDQSLLKSSIQDAINAEEKNIAIYMARLDQAKQLKKQILSEINTYNIQLTIYSNLILLPETSVKSLEQGLLDTQASIQQIANRSDELALKRTEVQALLDQAEEQISLTRQQVSEIKSGVGDTADGVALKAKLKGLSALLDKKRTLLTRLLSLYAEVTLPTDEVKAKFLELAQRFDRAINQKKKQNLLERKNPFVSLQWVQIADDIQLTVDQLGMVATRAFWQRHVAFFTISGALFKTSFILVFCLVLLLILRLRKFLIRWADADVFKPRTWNRLVMRVLRQSIVLLGISLFLYACLQAGLFHTNALILNAVVDVLFLWIFTGWCMAAAKLYPAGNDELRAPIIRHLRILITLIRCFGVIHIVFAWLHPDQSVILILWRLGFELALYGWALSFWKTIDRRSSLSEAAPSKKAKAVISALKSCVYGIILAGLILELAGYSFLALFWFVSWGQTIIVILWGGMIFMLLREWNPKLLDVEFRDTDEMQTTGGSIRWVAVHLSMLMWFGCLVVLMVLAWGGKQAVLVGIFRFLKHPFQIGNMQFSLLGFIIAIFILLITHGIARVWHHLFREKILKKSGMEEGLQDSITTITIYIIWAMGIIFALNAFGVNAATLMVVLGALGIGLGFGLQNIFNNFISGIILLFERPIQVGDDIEINGTWATVRKINVRSTVVQTYDNASLIIPNSDLISAQVTNWSFKDKRLRRNISVGVAYGSDTELVRQTLLEVAEKTPRVLKSPKPDVVFKDFGDSALIFFLRIWTRVDYFYSVETEIRFMIDRLFRERNIVIAFPQRDIHVINNADKPLE